jgi:hypothetical protein
MWEVSKTIFYITFFFNTHYSKGVNVIALVDIAAERLRTSRGQKPTSELRG